MAKMRSCGLVRERRVTHIECVVIFEVVSVSDITVDLQQACYKPRLLQDSVKCNRLFMGMVVRHF